jgi:glycosyltransferase involved in cell wall biosynthesis
MSQELVSVIMPTFNTGKFLSESIESVLHQTYTNLELLVTDDGSTDETLKILESYAQKDSRVKVFNLKNHQGPGHARNNSIQEAQGRYIAFCDSDDRWMPEKLERQIQFMHQKECALCCSSYITCDDKNKETGMVCAPEKISFSMMKRDNKIGCLTAVYDTQLLGKKYYMPPLQKRQDWALFLDITKQCHMAYGITEPLAYYRQRNNSVSSNKLALIPYNIKVYETILGYSPVKASLYFFFLFLPSYYMKVLKRNRDSKEYLKKRHLFTQ